MLPEVMGKVGRGCYVKPPLHLDLGCNVLMGEGVVANLGYVAHYNISCLRWFMN